MRFFTTALLTFCSLTIFSQKIEVGPSYERDNNDKPVILGEDERFVYTGGYIYEELMLESYNKNSLDREYFKTIEFEWDSHSRVVTRLERLTYLEGKIIAIFSYRNMKDDISALIIHSFNAEDGVHEAADTILHKELENFPVFSSGKETMLRWGLYDYQTSRDNKRLVIHSISKHFETNRFHEEILLINSDLEIVKKKEFIREKEENLISGEIFVDNEGSIYFIRGNDFVFLDYFLDYEEWREPLPSDVFESNAFASHLSASFKPNGNLVLIAQYVTEDIEDTNEEKEGSETEEGDTQVEGVLYLEVNGLSKEIKKVEVSMFEEELLDEFLTEDLIEDEHTPEINDIFSQFNYHFTDSTIFVIGEASVFRRFGAIARDNLLVYAFNTNGKLRWVHHIPKLQEAIFASGYAYYIDKDKLHVFFHEDEDNIEEGKREVLDLDRLERTKDATPVLYSFNRITGEQEYEVFESWNREGYRLIPHLSNNEKGEDGLFIFMRDWDEYRLTRIEF